MSHTYITDCTDSKKGDDTLIIIVNSDGTVSVDPETLQKLLANQHQNSSISLVRLDAKSDGGGGDTGCEDDDDPDSRVNLTVEGYYPSTPAPSSPTPPHTPIPDSISSDVGGSELLADSITEILQPEDVEKLETALQSERAKEILGDVVLDMLQKNGESKGMAEELPMTQQGSVVLDHCYASLTGPVAQPPAAPPPTQPTRGTGRGRGRGSRGRGGSLQVQNKVHVTATATMVPLVEQLVMPQITASVAASPTTSIVKNQATAVALQRINLQQVLPNNVVPCTVMLNKVALQSKPPAIAPMPSGAGDALSLKPSEPDILTSGAVTVPKKRGRGRGVTTRGGRGRGQGRGRGAPPRPSTEVDAKAKQLADAISDTVQALTLAEAEQFAQIESMDQSTDADRVIPLVNKEPVKKPIKVYRRAVEAGSLMGLKTLKVLKPEKQPQKPKGPKKSLPVESSSHDIPKPAAEPKKEEKVIVVSMEPQITPAVVSAVVMSQGSPSPTVAPPVPPTPTAAPAVTPGVGNRKNYPKRENRKPPAHLVEAFGPALFSTPDIIRRVSTDKPNTPVTLSQPQTSQPPTPTTPVTPSVTSSKLEDELSPLTEPDGIMDTITSQVSKQEDQLLAEALLLDDLATLPSDLLQDEVPLAKEPEEVLASTTPTATKTQVQKNKNLAQTTLAAFFPKVTQNKEDLQTEPVAKESPSVAPAVVNSPTARILPPVELPATRGAAKRATLQTPQETQAKKQETVKKVASSVEKRKSTDSKKSTESRKSAGRSVEDDSEDMLGSDEGSDDEGSYNSEDDPNRLWCICKRPHNNRFMICCDSCEDWFHGKCVGITKAMGEQMEEQEIEWMCPNCKKKKKQDEVSKKQVEAKVVSPKKVSTPVQPEVAATPVAETLPSKKAEASKVIIQHQKLVVLSNDTPKTTKGPEIRITKVSTRKQTETRKSLEGQGNPSTTKSEPITTAPASAPVATSPAPAVEIPHRVIPSAPVVECLVCKKEAMAAAVYCSDECIAKHSADSLATLDKSSIIVYERKTGRMYGGPNPPTPSTLTSWLMAHPSYEVMQGGVLPSAKFYNQHRTNNKPPTRTPQPLLKQTVLQTRPQGIQLIAALPQPPPIEGPLKKNLSKTEPSPTTQKTKPQAIAKGQPQITTLLKVQQPPKQEVPEVKPVPTKTVAAPSITPPVKKQAKETKKTTQQPPPKKTPPAPVVKKVVKEETKPEQKKEEGRGKDFEEQTVRSSVKKMLHEALTSRLQETTDLKLSEEQVKKLATQIEEELYALFKETSVKYKAKYRSLMFNIKDKNNLTLFRKIADKSLSPIQLVRLSPEELASQELAQWREREARHQLEMIKKTELDMMQQAKTVVMKTHKGEQVVENEDGLGAKVLETSVEIEPVNVSTPVTPTSEVPSLKQKEEQVKAKEDKLSKKEKKEEKHKERRHSHKGKEHKDHERSRSRRRSRHKSESGRRSRSKSRTQTGIKQRSRSGSVEEAGKNNEFKTEESGHSRSDRGRSRRRERERSKSRSRERSKSRPRDRSKSRARDRSKSRPRERSKSRPRERSKSRPRERSKSSPRERSKSRSRERSKSRTGDKDRSRSKNRSVESRSKSQTRSRSKSKPRERSKSRSRKTSQDSEACQVTSADENILEQLTIEKVHEGIDIPSIRPAIFDAEIKDIIHDVVVEEEIGAEAEEDLSDREPSSTVNINTPPLNSFEDDEPTKPPIWRGTLLMPDVAKFSTSIQEVSGFCSDLEDDLPDTIDCVGRISPETAWDYIAKMKKSGTKQILVIRFSADNEEDKMSYLSFYSYLSSRNRLGVVGNSSKMIKDFYILPLPSHSPVPQVLLPLDGPGFEDYRPHLLLGIIVRTRRKRLLTDNELPFVPKMSKKSERSYTPPLPDEDSHTPTQQHQQPDTESFTPPHSPDTPNVIKLKTNNHSLCDSPAVSEDFVVDDGDTPYTPEDEDPDAPYSPSGDASNSDPRVRSPGCSAELQRKVDELNRMINDIEERKQKIDSLSTIVGMSPPQEIMIGTERAEEEIEEAYSPSGSITPPPTDSSYLKKGKGSSKVSLPLDLQDIISKIKKIPDEPKSMDLKSDPIVQAYRSEDAPYSPEEDTELAEEDTKIVEEDIELKMSPNSEESFSTQSSIKSTSASVKVNRDPRQRPVQLSLSQLSDEEIMKKASEMGFMNPENPEPIPDVLKSRSATDIQSAGSGTDEERSKIPPPPIPVFMNQQFPSSQSPYTPDFPPPPRPPPHMSQGYLPHMYPAAPLPSLPSSHIPFTNPQPPPPKPMYPPPPPQSLPLPPPPPSEPLPDLPLSKKKFSKKSKKKSRELRDLRELRSRKEKKEKRRYSESPPPKDYDDSKFEKIRERDRYSSKKRERRDTWRGYDKSPLPEKRRESWEYEAPPPQLPPPPVMQGPPPPHSFSMPGPMRGPMRGRFQRGMRGFRRGFDRPPMRGGFHRGGFHQRGHHQGPPPGPSRSFQPKSIQSEFEEDIRRFEEQRLKQKNLERRRWRNGSPPPTRKRRVKEDDSD